MKTPKLLRAARRYCSMRQSIQMWKPSNTPHQSEKPKAMKAVQFTAQTPLSHQGASLNNTNSSENIYEEIPSFAVKTRNALMFTPVSKVAKRLNYVDQVESCKDKFLAQFSPIVSTSTRKDSIMTRAAMLQIADYEGEANTLQEYKGQIKVKIHTVNSELVVDICQAKDLPSVKCDSFVQVSLIDEQSEVLPCNTSVVYQSHNPVYDEKFTYHLLQEDYRKRILISVWNFEEASKEGELVGCMSFGIENIAARGNTVDGWYYLLEENIGERKHMKVKPAGSAEYEVPISLYCNTQQTEIFRRQEELSATIISKDSGHSSGDSLLI